MLTRLLLTGSLLLLAACSSDPTPDGGGIDDGSTPGDATVGDDGSVEPARSRDLTFRFREASSLDGQPLGAWLVDSTGQHVMAYAYVGAIAGGEAEIRMPDLVPEGDYHLDVFADADRDGAHGGSEPSWRVTVPANGSATASLSPSERNTDITSPPRVPRLDVTLSLTGFAGDETGQRFELRVIHPSRGTIGSYSTPALTGSSVAVTLRGIAEEGDALQVDYWVDMNADGVYSGPSDDRTWRQEITATGSGASLTWARAEPSGVDLEWR